MKFFCLLNLFVIVTGTVAMAEDFHGYRCTVDCSGHKAGYDWAARRGIDDPDSCGGNSNSFIEGCRAYAEEQLDSNSVDEESEDENVEE